ncbi:FABP family protein [Gordonia shandongensis]|uniref:FABP family protein n=1 Tax=Gordonia shandongensis TaxID=376351 RepID=UPI0004033D69|nr:FABP family protein [Gordonia shandongensis]
MTTAPRSLATFAGLWRGPGEGHYPTIDDFTYTEEIELTEVPGKPFLSYRSRTRAGDDGRALHTEVGYLRPVADGVELLITQPTGFTEIHRASGDGSLLDFDEHDLGVSPDAKDVRSVRRRWRIDGDTLQYDLWMAFADIPMTHHLRAELRRA